MGAGDQTRRGVTAMMAAVFSAPSLARGQLEAPTGTRILSPTTDPGAPYSPPMSLATVADIYMRMTAPVTIDGQGPFAFVVDTGANQTVISEDAADQLNLPKSGLEPLHGVAGEELAPTVRVRELKVGDLERPDTVLSVLPGKAIGAQGMLGVDRLEGQTLVLDFRHQRIEIGRSGLIGNTSHDIVIRARRENGQLTLVKAELADVPVTALLDSGAQSTIGNMALAAMALKPSPDTIRDQVPILSATGQTIEAELANLPVFRVGGLGLRHLTVAFADCHTFRIWDLVKQPAILLGVDVLSRFERVALDFTRGEVSFRLPESMFNG